jgi:hypothetical protein
MLFNLVFTKFTNDHGPAPQIRRDEETSMSYLQCRVVLVAVCAIIASA